MPIINKNQTYINQRFDFGVPLEDIFPTNDIHPRLKHLFHLAYNNFISNDTDIEQTLKKCQGTLEDRFNLKERLIYEVPCNINDNATGSYFWLIRHFLGLLPIPLLPKYHQDFDYNWEKLGKKCQMVLTHNEYDVSLKYYIARCIDTLPIEHFLLLSTLVNFIRKIAFRFGVLHKHNLICLAKYYCGSVFVRPYRPGSSNDRNIFPLFIYLLTKWNKTIKECKRNVNPESARDYYPKPKYQMQKSTHCQTEFKHNHNLFHSNIYCYKCDGRCQTDFSSNPKKYCCTQSCQTEINETTDFCCQTDLNLEDSGIIEPIANSSVINNSHSEKYYTALHNDASLQEREHSESGKNSVSEEIESKVDFVSILDSNNTEWSDVMKETEKTVQKIEEYIYDDYETFRWEDYNQISIEKRNMSTFRDNTKLPVWTDCSPRSLMYRESIEENELSVSELISDKTYYKFQEIDDDFTESSSSEQATARQTEGANLSVYTSKSCDHVTQSPKKKSEELQHNKSKIYFGLRRFRMSFNFLRGFIGKTKNRANYSGTVSNIRYKKIINNKASTL